MERHRARLAQRARHQAGEADRALALLETVKPDLILSGGDLVDAPPFQLAPVLARFAALKPPLGQYAVLGNHDYYTGLSNALAAHEAAGFRMLRETRVEPLPGLVIAGVDDRDGKRAGDVCLTNESAALPPPTAGVCVILLKHRPLVTPVARAGVDLQLSGHTHGGQIFPFAAMVRVLFEHLDGLHALSPRTRLYVSRGTGTWGPPLRLGAPPEITLLTIPAANYSCRPSIAPINTAAARPRRRSNVISGSAEKSSSRL